MEIRLELIDKANMTLGAHVQVYEIEGGGTSTCIYIGLFFVRLTFEIIHA